jgi:hypothetical protein
VNLPHLVRRFFGALRPGPPSPDDEAWAEQMLTPGELPLYRRLPNHDRRHAVRSGRRAATALGPQTEARWIAAAMLHDVGKHDADLSVPGRAVATVLVAGRGGADRVERWRKVGGFRHRVALYADHGDLGAAQIRRAGGREEAARWAAAHHHPESWDALGWPVAVVAALDGADQE